MESFTYTIWQSRVDFKRFQRSASINILEEFIMEFFWCLRFALEFWLVSRAMEVGKDFCMNMKLWALVVLLKIYARTYLAERCWFFTLILGSQLPYFLQELLTQGKSHGSSSANEEVDLDELMDVSGRCKSVYLYYLLLSASFHLFLLQPGSWTGEITCWQDCGS